MRATNLAEKLKTIKQGKLTFYYGIEQGTQEWLDLRADKVTCSNALDLCFKGKKTAIERNRQHAERMTPNGNQYAERGHVLEDEVKKLLEENFNNEVHELLSCSFITNDDYPDAGYSPDAIILEKGTGKFIAPVEVKCFNDETERWDKKQKTFVKQKSDKHALCCEDIANIPLENRMQFEMEMVMTETEKLLVVLYNPDADIEAGVPKLKIWQYTPEEAVDENGVPCHVYQQRIKQRLLESLEK